MASHQRAARQHHNITGHLPARFSSGWEKTPNSTLSSLKKSGRSGCLQPLRTVGSGICGGPSKRLNGSPSGNSTTSEFCPLCKPAIVQRTLSLVATLPQSHDATMRAGSRHLLTKRPRGYRTNRHHVATHLLTTPTAVNPYSIPRPTLPHANSWESPSIAAKNRSKLRIGRGCANGIPTFSSTAATKCADSPTSRWLRSTRPTACCAASSHCSPTDSPADRAEGHLLRMQPLATSASTLQPFPSFVLTMHAMSPTVYLDLTV